MYRIHTLKSGRFCGWRVVWTGREFMIGMAGLLDVVLDAIPQ